jgi:hypothetical protein
VLCFFPFLGIFFGDICPKFDEINCWICIFEWLNIYNPSALGVFHHAKSIYAFINEI